MYLIRKGRLSLSDEICNKMIVKISKGIWREGEKIPSESKLCEMFKVSRVSVRAALQKLQGYGLITTKQGIGSFVIKSQKDKNTENIENTILPNSDITSEAFLEFFEFRQAIEFKAIDLFVIKATQEDFKELEKSLEGFKKFNHNYIEYTKYDFNFHMSVIRGSKNEFLYNAITPYKEIFYHYLEEINRLSGVNAGEVHGGHFEYYKALIKKRPTDAKKMLLSNNYFYHLTLFSNLK